MAFNAREYEEQLAKNRVIRVDKDVLRKLIAMRDELDYLIRHLTTDDKTAPRT